MFDRKKMHDAVDEMMSEYEARVSSANSKVHTKEEIIEKRKLKHDQKELEAFANKKTGHALLMYIINSKIDTAIRMGINIRCSLSKTTPMDSWDDESIIRLISNILNNSIESCSRVGRLRRRISILIDEERLIVKNAKPIVVLTNKVNGRRTSKSDVNNHGFGTQIIRDITLEKNAKIYVTKSLFSYKLVVNFV